MGLTIQQEIAALRNRLVLLEQKIASEAPLEFELVFKYKTFDRHWAVSADVEEIKLHVEDFVSNISEELTFNEEGEEFYLSEVKEVKRAV
jgi:hypothetical protein